MPPNATSGPSKRAAQTPSAAHTAPARKSLGANASVSSNPAPAKKPRKSAPANLENSNGVAGDPEDSQDDFEILSGDDDQPTAAKKGKGKGKSPQKQAPVKKAAPAKKKPTVTKKATITIRHDTPKELAAFLRISARAVGLSSERLRLDKRDLKARLLDSQATSSLASVLLSSPRVTAGVHSQVLKGLRDDVANIKARRESILEDIERMTLGDEEDVEKVAREAQGIADAEEEEETELSEGEDEEE
ncbi:hypothetical protein L202_04503 [Cryptococcus amylolentus CBS 6039]|uniref:Uncharacterized protein n=2 Tax=Cryptococcus amylolentus TaxID=104669 RepID=A0A1E3HRR1_9TREE|nr:hypothetical protein L202_04503 [Cryptococcus amylolentus CBS 6039]ODN78992.1 hypothetical protein L202_04503 [Cryptococcus amylolentus CBS 6039]ODO06564.1 hypothetical protein I350_03919 [Cryptococcus amylolentus CBS 6273]